MKSFIIAMTALTVLSGTAMAAPQKQTPKHPVAKPAKVALICPVTGDKIASAAKAVGHSTFKGKTYYFCCPGCKPRFDKAPAKFVKNSAKGKFEAM